MTLAAIDLFSGAGGLSIALKESGFQILFANEIHQSYAKTHKHNFPEVPLIEMDIRDLDEKTLLEKTQGIEVDLITGGPPCQGFSIFGKRRFVNTQGYEPRKDPRNQLVYEFMRVVRILKPKFFFMENVKGFTNLDKGHFVEEIKKQFRELGYDNLWCEVVLATDYGVPQKRQRMFMIGNRIGVEFEAPPHSHFPIGSGSKPEYATVGPAIMDLAGRENQVLNHVPLNHKPIVEARYGHIAEGARLNVNKLPPELAVATRKDSKSGKVSNYSHVYKRLHRQQPSTTMVPGHNAFPVHPTLNRTLTAREAARLQTFPDDHQFFGTRQEQCIQVGNAVPPKLAKPFFDAIKSHLL